MDPLEEIDPYEPDPSFVDAIASTESSYNPSAVSPKGAQGYMQIMPATFKQYAKEGEDPFNREDSIAVGSRYLRYLNKLFDNDPKLVAAAYNSGEGNVQRMREKYGDSYEDIEPHLTGGLEETRKYVPKVYDRYQKNKGRQLASEEAPAQPEVDYSQFDASGRGLAQALLPIVSEPAFGALSFEDQSERIAKVYNSKQWGNEGYEVLKQTMTNLSDAAEQSELPSLEEIIGPPPTVGSDQIPDQVLSAWKTTATQDLLYKGISPAIFGDRLDKYFDQASKQESEAFAIRNRSLLGKAVMTPINWARDVAKGAGYALTKPIAGVVRVLDPKDPEIANSIEELPELLGKPSNDYLYETDANGYLKYNPDGTPQYKWQSSIAQGIGQIGSLLTGGFAMKGLGYSANALRGTFFGVNTLTAANDSFRLVLDETKDVKKAYKAAAFAIPAAAIGSLGELAVVSKLANPAITNLSGFNKTKYLADVFARNAAVEGVANVGFDAVSQFGETLQTNKPFDAARLTQAGVSGAVAGGAIGAFQARGAQPENPAGLPTKIEAPKGLPAPAWWDPNQATLPAPQERLGLPGPVPLDQKLISSDTVPGPDSTAPIINFGAVSPEESKVVTTKLENFQKSTASQLVLTPEQASKIPTEFFDLFNFSATATEGQVTITKKESYIQKDSETPEGVAANIKEVQQDLESTPSPEEISSLPETILQLRRERNILAKEWKEKSKLTNEKSVALVQQHQDLQRNLDEKKAQYEDLKSTPELRVLAKEEMVAAERELADFNETWKDHEQEILAIGDVGNRLAEAKQQLTNAQKASYANDIKAKERNLIALNQKYEAFVREAQAKVDAKNQKIADTEAADRLRVKNEVLARIGVGEEAPLNPTAGINVDGATLIPHNDRWYVVDTDGAILGKHEYFKQAVDAVRSRADARSPERSFVTEIPKKQKTALTPEDKAYIRDTVAAEKENADRSAYEYNKTAPKETGVKGHKVKAAKRSPKPKKVGPSALEGEMGLNTGEPVESPEAPPLVESKLGPIAGLSEDRLRRSVPKKPLTSNYTKPVIFTETGTKVVKPQEIFKESQKLLSGIDKYLRVFQGGPIRRGTLGFLNYAKNFIKVGRFNDLPTMLHEITHGIDRALIGKWDGQGVGDYSQIPAKVQEAFMDMADTYYNFRSPPPDMLRLQEGIATFFQHHATGQPVRQEALNWYENSFAKQHPEVYKAMEAIREKTLEHFNQDPATFIQSLTVKKENPTKARLKQYYTLANLRDTWIDRSAIFKDFDKAAGKGSRVKDIYDAQYGKAKAVTDTLVHSNLVDLNGNTVNGLSLQQALSPAEGKGELLESYMIARRSAAYMQAGLESGVNLADTYKVINSIERSHPDVVTAAQNYYAFREHVLDMMAASSREGAATVAKLREANLKETGTTHGYYVPFGREGKGRSNPFAKRVGSTRSIVSPLETIKDSVEATLTRAYLSQVKEAMLDQATGPSVSNVGMYMRELTGTDRIGIQKQYNAEATAKLGDGATTEDKVMYAFSATPMEGVSGSSYKIIPFMDGNKVRFFEVHERVINAFSNGLPDVVNNPLFRYIARPIAQTFRPFATSLRAAFQVKQLVMRDTLTAYRYVQTGEGNFKDALLLGRALMQSLNDVSLHTLGFKNNGWAALAERLGLANATYVGDIQDVRAEMQKKFGKNFLDFADTTLTKIENALSIPEQATRQAVMRLEARRLGIANPNQKLTPAQALELTLAFKRGTTNFQVQGSSARAINLAVPFFTARIAEVSRLPGDFKRNPGKVAALGASMLGYGIYHALAHKDDVWYQELTPGAKTSSIFTKININGVDKLAFIPLDSWSSATFGLGQMIGTKMTEDKTLPVSYVDLARAYIGQHTPVGSWEELLTPVGKEILQQYSNWDTFFQRSIVPPNLQYQDKKEQFNEYTSELAKAVGGLIDESPMRIDHAIRSVAPAASDLLHFADRTLGYKKAKEYEGLNFVTAALTKSGSASGQMDRSQMIFTDKLLEARGRQIAETAEEGIVRKALEKINKNLTYINTVIYASDDQEIKDKLRVKKRELLQQGIRISQGAIEKVAPSAEKSQAEKIRKSKKLAQGEAIRNREENIDVSYKLQSSSNSE